MRRRGGQPQIVAETKVKDTYYALTIVLTKVTDRFPDVVSRNRVVTVAAHCSLTPAILTPRIEESFEIDMLSCLIPEVSLCRVA